ncbi:MAG: FG-GAP-like repeat-containing protein, partial [Candidatus Kapaibacterium sp.]
AAAIGCSWRDYDNNGTLDLILPQGIVSREGIGTMAGSAVLSTTERDPAKLVRNPASDGIAMMVNHAGGTWGDVDNDGLADLILTSSCSCTPVDLYLQTPTHSFERKTFEAGLFRQPGGEDATWVDVNNDGKLDLAFLSEGKLYLYQNQNSSAAHFVEIDLLSPDGGSAITGADIVVAAGGKHYRQIIASGRGLMMQDPTRLHFGLGEDSRIDSITVTMPNGHAATTFRDIPVDRIARLNLDGKGAHADALAPFNVSATPNPFSTRLAVQYTLVSKQHVRVEIYSPSGALAQILVDEEEPAGEHLHYWNTVESDRATLSQGAYLYRITADGHEATGKVILQR